MKPRLPLRPEDLALASPLPSGGVRWFVGLLMETDSPREWFFAYGAGNSEADARALADKKIGRGAAVVLRCTAVNAQPWPAADPAPAARWRLEPGTWVALSATADAGPRDAVSDPYLPLRIAATGESEGAVRAVFDALPHQALFGRVEALVDRDTGWPHDPVGRG